MPDEGPPDRGAGFVASHVAEQLLVRGHEVAVVDDLSSGKKENVPKGAVFYEWDIRDGYAEVFEEFDPETNPLRASRTSFPFAQGRNRRIAGG